MYDFYYSARHEAHMKKMNEMRGEKYHYTFINGTTYTEMIIEGREPVTKHFGDLTKICTEDKSKITF